MRNHKIYLIDILSAIDSIEDFVKDIRAEGDRLIIDSISCQHSSSDMQADRRITSWTGWLGLMVLDERLKAYRQAQETKGRIQSMILCGAML